VSGEATVEGDPARLRQVLLNLAKNGAEAAGPGGWVDLSLAVEGAEARVTVCDSGPGLTQEAREHLFELFFTTKPKGTGLGLAVSKAIARAHGGELEQGASALGGACFRLRLPLQQPLTGAAEGGAR
jgi:signal transduction histidine kinase